MENLFDGSRFWLRCDANEKWLLVVWMMLSLLVGACMYSTWLKSTNKSKKEITKQTN